MKVLILGGTGAMGTPLAEILADKNFDVHVTSRKERLSTRQNLSYILGDAKNNDFLLKILQAHTWDAVIDFMVYGTEEFKSRADMLLSGTKQYIFISSARVYSRSEVMITEQTPRLLDVCEDKEYLQTDEYALTKARQENILRDSGKNNYTIIRPSITYNDRRLQLGVLEKENIFYRVLHGRSIVFSRDIADKVTTMTWGYNVAEGIAAIIGQNEALSQIFHITEKNAYKWSEILDIYLDVLEQKLGKRPRVVMTDKSTSFLCGNKYQIIYCRYFNRKFDNSKISRFINESAFVDAKEGLKNCLARFLDNPEFNGINWTLEAINDRAAGEMAQLSEISGFKNKLRYILLYYHLDFIRKIYRLIKRCVK